MSFAENLRKIRKEKGVSQEDLAGIMDVSRQAVSKWEQGEGYPEVEKLLLLSSRLNISLDSLMAKEILQEGASGSNVFTGSITIISPYEAGIVTCQNVISSQKYRGGKNSPEYALLGVHGVPHPYWGRATTFLGWYAK